MIRNCLLFFWTLFPIFQTVAQVQTLHNTLVKGTLSSSVGLQFKEASKVEFLPNNNYVFGINYCFKNRFSIGVEVNYNVFNIQDFSPGISWSSNNLLAGINLQRNDHLFKTKMGKFKIASTVNLGGGSIISNDQLNHQNLIQKSPINLTGFYMSIGGGLRFEFLRRIFLEVKESGGYLSKNNVNLRLNNQNMISTNNWFIETQIKFGIFMFINTLDKCGTCPKW